MSETPTERHLIMLDRLAQIGMVLAERLHDNPTKNDARDLELIARAVRRCILLYHLLETNQLPRPRQPAEPKPEAQPAATPSGRTNIRLDPVDRLDDVSAPFEQVVASIVTDIKAALAGCHFPPEQADLVQQIITRPLPVTVRHEADTADLK